MSEAIKSLSEREKETLRLLLAGHDAKSIARDLGLSVHTVNDRLREARRKLGVSSSREAARLLSLAEGEHPKSLAPKNFGMAEQEIGSHQTVRTGPLTGINHRRWWLAGGVLMLFAIVAVALLSVNGVDGPRASALASQTSAPSPAPSSAASASQARKWLMLVDQQNWSESWRDAGTIFRSQISADGWASAIVPVRKPLGAVISRSLAKVTKATSLPGVPAGEYEVLEFQTNYAAKRGAIETVVMAKEQAGWRVNGYFIR
jgi:DNA-binding CsgD family transcriptional regulator